MQSTLAVAGKNSMRVTILCALYSGILYLLGRRWWCEQGGWAVWVPDSWSEHTSQHLFDPYSFSHVQHGLILFAFVTLLGWKPLNRAWFAGIIEMGWEILENTPLIIDRYRSVTASLDYYGDTILNSWGDLLSCMFGVWMAWRLPWKVSLGILIGIELLMVTTIRDSLALNVLMLIWPMQSIQEWQLGGQAHYPS